VVVPILFALIALVITLIRRQQRNVAPVAGARS